MWVEINNQLLTNVERHRRHITNNAECGMCIGSSELIDHILRRCPLARKTWIRTFSISEADTFFSLAVEDWWKTYLSDKKVSLIFGLTCWLLWKSRNERIFNGKALIAASIVEQGHYLVTITNSAYLGVDELKRAQGR
ncbi:Putative ribonuclease H protein At1g65750 [Linum perenne]